MDQQPLLHHRNDSDVVAITMEKDSAANSRSLKERHSVQRALGFKNIVIYVLVFVNLLLCSKVYSSWSSSGNNNNNKDSGAFHANGCSTLGEGEGGEHEGGDASTPEFWIKMALIMFLVLIGGVFAGKCSPRRVIIVLNYFVPRLDWDGHVCYVRLSHEIATNHCRFIFCPHESPPFSTVFALPISHFSFSLSPFTPIYLFHLISRPPFLFQCPFYFTLWSVCLPFFFASFRHAEPLTSSRPSARVCISAYLCLIPFLLHLLPFLLLLLHSLLPLGTNTIPDPCRIDDWSDGLGRDEPSGTDGFWHANGTSSCRDGVQIAVTRKALGLG